MDKQLHDNNPPVEPTNCANSDDVPAVYAIERSRAGWNLTRRDFLGAASSAAVLGSACQSVAKRGGDVCEHALAHKKEINALAVSADGKLLVSASADKTIKLWSLPEGALRATLAGYSPSITPVGKLLVLGDMHQKIKLWALPTSAQKMCLMDLEASTGGAKGSKYTARDEYGHEVTYTLPCGSPLPRGATCICNCVPASVPRPPVTRQHCTCVPVSYSYPN